MPHCLPTYFPHPLPSPHHACHFIPCAYYLPLLCVCHCLALPACTCLCLVVCWRGGADDFLPPARARIRCACLLHARAARTAHAALLLLPHIAPLFTYLLPLLRFALFLVARCGRARLGTCHHAPTPATYHIYHHCLPTFHACTRHPRFTYRCGSRFARVSYAFLPHPSPPTSHCAFYNARTRHAVYGLACHTSRTRRAQFGHSWVGMVGTVWFGWFAALPYTPHRTLLYTYSRRPFTPLAPFACFYYYRAALRTHALPSGVVPHCRCHITCQHRCKLRFAPTGFGFAFWTSHRCTCLTTFYFTFAVRPRTRTDGWILLVDRRRTLYLLVC